MTAGGKAGGRRWLIWGPLLAVSAWLAFFGDKSPAGDAAASMPARPQPPALPKPPAARAAATEGDALAALVPRVQLIPEAPAPAASAGRDPFSARSWAPPPPPAPPPAVAPAPTAPPLPYAFFGKKHEAGSWEVYFTRGELTFIAREGAVLEGTYRIEKIEPPTVTVTYLPLGQVQTLAIGEAR